MSDSDQIRLPIPNGYRPNEKQTQFHEAITKYRWYFGGIGSGKTAAIVNEHLSLSIKCKKDTRSAMIEPTYGMIKTVLWPQFFKFCPKEFIKSTNRSDYTVTLINDHTIHFFGGDTEAHMDKLRGTEFTHASVDEIGLFDEYILTVLAGRVRTKGGSLKIMLAGSPKGRGWIYNRLVEKAEEFKGMDTWIATITADNLQNLPPDFIDNMRLQLGGESSKLFQQEILGVFIGAEGLVYDRFSRQIHILKPEGQLKFKEVICGMDAGTTNPTVLLVIGIDYDNRIYIIEEVHERNLLITDFVNIAKEYQQKCNISMFYVDPSATQWIMAMRQAGLRVTEANNDVLGGIAWVSTFLEKQNDGLPKLFLHPKCKHTLEEFENYRYPDNKPGLNEEQKPLKAYDHCMDALRYALMSLFIPRPFVGIRGVRR